MTKEIGWLIERGDTPVSAPLYYAPQTDAGWDADHAKACRFARRQDAEVVAAAYGLDDETGIRICEHMWMDLPSGRNHFSKRMGATDPNLYGSRS